VEVLSGSGYSDGTVWLIRMTLHSVSTSLSHIATFTVLGGIRQQLCEKLSKIPLGSVLDDNSGSYKNIIVERVDSMGNNACTHHSGIHGESYPAHRNVYLYYDYRLAIGTCQSCWCGNRPCLYGDYDEKVAGRI
jgi:hypothetical protein